MQSEKLKNGYILLAVPIELVKEASIITGSPLELYVEGNKLIIESVDDIGDMVCDGDCKNCPIEVVHCDEDCSNCPSGFGERKV